MSKRAKYKVFVNRGPIKKQTKLTISDKIGIAYDKNFDKINKTHPVTKAAFEARITTLMQYNEKYKGLSVEQAIKKYFNTEQFTSVSDRMKDNLLSGLSNWGSKLTPYDDDKTMLNDFYALGGQKEGLSFNSELGGYTFTNKLGKTYLILVSNSPMDVEYRRIS